MTGERFLSDSWYRVAQLRPRLRDTVTVRMHRYRSQIWHVIADDMNNRVHRVSPAAYALIASMDGTRTLDSLWSDAAVALGEQAPTQDQAIHLLGQLHGNDLLAGDVSPDAHELFQRQGRQQRGKVMQRLLNPLAMRIPLVDPDKFLARTPPLVRPLIGPFGVVLWLAVTLPALLLAASHWNELSDNLGDRALSAGNLVLLAAVYPIIKLLHELGHAYTTKVRGAEVHELGVMLMVLLPMPYVDVSASAGFPGKWSRCLVGAAGILVELFLAALAMHVWLLVEPGLVRAIAFNVMLTAGVSSVLFNGNPLLRYDGYYILADAIEVPNLAQRGARYWSHLFRRYVFGCRPARDFSATPGERIWFLAYTPVAAAYRVAITISIALFLGREYLAAGVALALWGIGTGLILPVVRGLWAVLTGPEFQRNRPRAVGITFGAVVAVVVALLWVPAPLHTDAEAVVWLPDDAFLRAGTDGFITNVAAPLGSEVARGQVVVETADPELLSHLHAVRGREAELVMKLDSVRFSDRVEAFVTEAELRAVRVELAQAQQKATWLQIRAGANGIFVMPSPEDAPGRFVKRGQIIGYALPADGARTIRATISQENIDLVRHHVRATHVRLADWRDSVVDVRSVREVPGGDDKLPSAALGSTGGGATATDPRDEHGTKALNRVFQVDLEMAEPATSVGFGSRVHVRFEHEWEPLGIQLWRRTRQLLLSRLDV
jgi:putative peptide zinc metalloprotease protein